MQYRTSNKLIHGGMRTAHPTYFDGTLCNIETVAYNYTDVDSPVVLFGITLIINPQPITCLACLARTA